MGLGRCSPLEFSASGPAVMHGASVAQSRTKSSAVPPFCTGPDLEYKLFLSSILSMIGKPTRSSVAGGCWPLLCVTFVCVQKDEAGVFKKAFYYCVCT